MHLFSHTKVWASTRSITSHAGFWLNYPTTIEVFDNKLNIMSGASLYKLWKYSKRVRTILASDLTEFRMSSARGTVIGLRCSELSSFRILSWLDRYIESVGKVQTYLTTLNLASPWRATPRTRLIVAVVNVGPYLARPYTNFGKLWHLLSTAVSKRWVWLQHFSKLCGNCKFRVVRCATSLTWTFKLSFACVFTIICKHRSGCKGCMIESDGAVSTPAFLAILTFPSHASTYHLKGPQSSNTSSILWPRPQGSDDLQSARCQENDGLYDTLELPFTWPGHKSKCMTYRKTTQP